jgi:tellurite resistance protein
MLARPGARIEGLDAQEALICTIVLVAAADGGITDREIGVMVGLVQTLPVFGGFSSDRLDAAAGAAISLLREEDGLAHATRLIREALEPRLRETAYLLACEVVAGDGHANQSELQMLDVVREGLEIEPLTAAAIERGVRARYQRV